MKLVLVVWLAILGAMAATAAANPTQSTQSPNPYAATSDAAFAKAFSCPDPNAPLPERKAELKNFMDWVIAHHPHWTIAQLGDFRVKLLEQHHCTQTLRNIRAHAKPAKADSIAQMMASAKQGNARAQTQVCFAYALGRGLPRDYAQAFHWCTQAADQGFAPAQYGLGLLYARGNGVTQDYGQAILWYRKAAEQGFPPAQFNLGRMHATGTGVPRDDSKAIEWYRKAAEQGHAPAQANLGYMYLKGTGVPKDYAKAIEWLTKAADHGNASAQNSLGAMYAAGQGVPKDDVTAAKWFMLVKGQGQNFAACNLARTEARMTPAQIESAQNAAGAWQTAHGAADVSINAPASLSDCPGPGKHYGVARFTTEQAGRNAAADLLDRQYGNVALSEVAARGFAPDTAVDPNQAENWAHGIEAYLRLDGYKNFSTTLHQSSSPEFNAFLDAMTNQEGRTNMGSRSYANLAAAHPSNAGTAGLAPLPQVVALPQTATIATRLVHKRFRVAAATSADAKGESMQDIPAWQVKMLSGAGDWQRTVPAALPKSTLDAPAATRNQLALFLVNGGWIAVPKGWHVLSAVDAVTPTWAVTFVAPGGASEGWLAVGGAGPGTSEVFSGAEGYFPDAYRLYDDILPGSLARDPTLSPTPDSLAHPEPCTALVTYGSGDLVVQGVKLFQPSTDSIDLSPYVRSYFIALPKSDAALQGFLTRTFRQQHPVQDCRKRS